MPIDDVRAGMTGVGWTVFSGEKREEFKVHILGVLRNVIGPQRNLILARLEGGPLADTGVIAGMSGSPVYVDGRLVGAVSYSLGSFPKEAIAGITPIGEMVEATATSVRAEATRVKLDLPLTPERVRAALAAAFARVQPFARAEDELEVLGMPRQAGAELGLQLRPIATPFVMSGFAGAPAELLRAAGFAPGDAAQAPAPGAAALEPGDAVGVVLLGGDLEMGATGTVTYVDGRRVYAFGHPFFNLGPISFPMTRASIYSLLPSYMSSQKIAGLGPVVGAVDQDRATAIAGELGAPPRLIPMKVTLASDRGFTRTFQLPRGRRPVLHAAARLPGGGQHAVELRAAGGHRHVRGRGDGAHRRSRAGPLRRSLRRPQRDDGDRRLRRGPGDDAARQRPRAGAPRVDRPVDPGERAAAHRDDRARLARRDAPARGPDRAGQGAGPRLRRRRPRLHRARRRSRPTRRRRSRCSCRTPPASRRGSSASGSVRRTSRAWISSSA